jgi:hypothetical protein
MTPSEQAAANHILRTPLPRPAAFWRGAGVF